MGGLLEVLQELEEPIPAWEDDADEFNARVRDESLARVRQYTADMTPDEVLDEVIAYKGKRRGALRKQIFEKDLTAIIASEATGIRNSEGFKKLSPSERLCQLAKVLSRSTVNSRHPHEFFRKRFGDADLAFLMHQPNGRNFTLEFVMQASVEELEERLKIRKPVSLIPGMANYNPALHELSSDTIAPNRRLQFELFKKMAGIEALEQIVASGKGNIRGYKDLRRLITLLNGKRLTKGKTRIYVFKLCEEFDMPLLTQEHQEYVNNFSVEYLKGKHKTKLRKEVPLESYHISPRSKKYSAFLAALSEKISQDRALQREFLMKWTGKRKLKDLGYKEKLIYLAHFLSADPEMPRVRSMHYCRQLFPEYKLPINKALFPMGCLRYVTPKRSLKREGTEFLHEQEARQYHEVGVEHPCYSCNTECDKREVDESDKDNRFLEEPKAEDD